MRDGLRKKESADGALDFWSCARGDMKLEMYRQKCKSNDMMWRQVMKLLTKTRMACKNWRYGSAGWAGSWKLGSMVCPKGLPGIK